MSLAAPAFRKLAWMQTILIFVLVPSGRWLQTLGSSILAGINMETGLTIKISLGLISLALGAYYRTLMKFQSWRFAATHLAILSVLAWPVTANLLYPVEFFHIVMFALLTALIRLSFNLEARADHKSLLLTGLVSLIDEGLQELHPQRVFDWRDVGLDLAGAMIGGVLVKPFIQYVPDSSPPRPKYNNTY